MQAKDVENALSQYANSEDALFLQRFFKTGEGQYGEGDVFIGVRVPDTRRVCAKFYNLPLTEVKKLLASTVHEYRLAAVILLANAYKEGNESERRDVYECYLRAVYDGHINNWDIVDISAEFIIGEHLRDKPKRLLERLATSPDLWHRRVAVLSTFAYIKSGDGSETIKLAKTLLHDPHDLIQKAVGWMLREVGKRCDEAILRTFLDAHAHEMPRTMLRYAIERLDSASRKKYMTMKGA